MYTGGLRIVRPTVVENLSSVVPHSGTKEDLKLNNEYLEGKEK